ncbi:hypothetical protein Q0812_13190 [Brevundimonas sp. 2R-24]|uniref:Uncharacterized protein n=1 Tax=Peiella sedimenti TaxID=3061083 RepID=A0ABT8SPB9_9CAUL|nr:hypothetical protein [Caulobacteraceae bacterium XZ-24]
MTTPLPCTFMGDHFAIGKGWVKRANEEYGLGEVVSLIPHEGRSQASHRHYFASVAEAWLNLPENLAERFATSEHLRKYALIQTGHRDERTMVCSSKAEAQRLAAISNATLEARHDG